MVTPRVVARNMAIRTVGRVSSPEVNQCFFSNQSCETPGFSALVFQSIARSYNLTIIPLFVMQNEVDPQNVTNSTFQMLKLGEADISLETITLTPQRHEYLPSISQAIYDVYFDLLVQTSYETDVQFLVFRPFQYVTWALIVAAAIVHFLVRNIVRRNTEATITKSMRKVIANLAATIVFGLYSSVLTLQLYTAPTLRYPFRTLEELADKLSRRELRLLLESNRSNRARWFAYPDNQLRRISVFNQLHEAALVNTPIFNDNKEECIDMVAKNPTLIYPIESTACEHKKYCNLAIVQSKPRVYGGIRVYFFSPAFRYYLPLDSSVMTLHNTIKNKECDRAAIMKNCTQHVSQPKLKEIDLKDVLGALVLLLCGLALSAVVFLLVEWLRCDRLMSAIDAGPRKLLTSRPAMRSCGTQTTYLLVNNDTSKGRKRRRHMSSKKID